jgi:hypothetical protein
VVLSVEVFDCFKVKQRVGGDLDVPCIFVVHSLEALGSTLGEDEGGDQIDHDTCEIDQENLSTVQNSDCGNHKHDLEHNWDSVEEHESQDLGKRVSSLAHDFDDSSCLSVQVELQALVLNVSVHHGGDVHFSISAHIRKWHLSDVVQEIRGKLDNCVQKDQDVVFPGKGALPCVRGIRATDILHDLSHDEGMDNLSNSRDYEEHKHEDRHEFDRGFSMPNHGQRKR